MTARLQKHLTCIKKSSTEIFLIYSIPVDADVVPYFKFSNHKIFKFTVQSILHTWTSQLILLSDIKYLWMAPILAQANMEATSKGETGM